MKQITGRAFNLGDDITSESLCAATVKAGPGAQSARPGDIPEGAVVIAGQRFGSGEQCGAAAALLRERGVKGVVAASFGRRFYREAINSGLALFTSDLAGSADDGDEVSLDLRKGTISVGDRQVQAEKYPERLARVVEYGSLLTAIKRELGKE